MTPSAPKKTPPTRKKKTKKDEPAPLHSVNGAVLLDVRECAALLGASQHAVRSKVARRTLPFRRHGSRVLFVKAELEQFLAQLPGVSVSEALSNIVDRQERSR